MLEQTKEVKDALRVVHDKSLQRHRANGGVAYADWQKASHQKDTTRYTEGVDISEIESVKKSTDVELVRWLKRKLREGYGSPLQEEMRWMGVQLKKPDDFLWNEDCNPIANEFRNMDADEIVERMQLEKAFGKQGATKDGYEQEWENAWQTTNDPQTFLACLKSKSPTPIIFVGSDKARWQCLQDIGATYTFADGSTKYPDVLVACRGFLVIGERKTIANQGGQQNMAIQDALRFPSITDVRRGVIGTAVIIGSYWDTHDAKLGGPGVIHTALFKDFVNTLPIYEGTRW